MGISTVEVNAKRIGILNAKTFALGMFIMLLPVIVSAQFSFSDNATNYGGSWTNGSNQGTGYNGWAITTGGANAGTYIGDPAGSGLNNANIGATSFAMFGHSGQYVNTTRYFGAGGTNVPMLIGDVFSFYWSMNWDCGSSGSKGFDLRADGATIFNVNNSNSATISTTNGNAFTAYGTNAMLVTLTRTSWTQYSFSMTARDGGATYNTTITSSANINNINMYCGAQQDNNGNRNIFFNAFNFTKAAPYETNFDVTDPRILTGGNNLTKTGAGNLTLTGVNTFTGNVIVNANFLIISNDNQLGAVPGAATADKIQIGAGTLGINGTFSINSNRGMTLNNAASTIDVFGAQTATYSGIIAGTGNLTKAGPGTLILGGTNTYTGTTTVSNNVLRITNASALGANTAGTTVNSGCAIEFSGAFTPITEPFTINGVGIANGGALRNVTNNTRSISGTVFLTTDSRINSDQATLTVQTIDLNSQTLYAGGAGTVEISTALSNGGKTLADGAIFKDGAGELILSGAFTALTGTINLTAGTIRINNNAGLGNTGTLNMSNGTILRPDNTTSRTTSKNILINGNITLGYSGAGLTLTGTVNLNGGTRTITSLFGNTISGVISNGGLTKFGADNLTLSGANTYVGNTTISTGNLIAASAGAFGGGTDVFIANGATLTVSASTSAASVREAGTSNSGTVILNTGTILTINGANKGTFFQNSISGAGGLTMAGSGTTNMSLFGTQSYTGSTTVSGGQLTSPAAMSTSSLTVSGGVFSAGAADILGNTIPVTVNSGTYQLGGNETIGSLTGTGGTVNMGASTLTAGNDNSNTSYSGIISGTGGLTKIGTGTFTLNGTVKTYTGNTTVNNGTLTVGVTNVINSASNLVLTNGTFNISSGANLTLNSVNMTGGAITRAGNNSFTVNNSSSFTGGTVTYSSTGSIIANGTTTLGNVTFNSTSTSGTTHSTIQLGGDIIVNNNTTANFTNTGGGTGVRFNLGDAIRTINVGTNAFLNIAWRINSSTLSSGGIIKTGAGRLTITHESTLYTGPTTVTAGELRLNPVNTTASWSSPVTLNGGTLATTGIAANTTITNATAGVTLNVNANSTINLGNVNHSIIFANSSAVTWNGSALTIFGWTGTLGTNGTNGRIFFGNNSSGLTSDQLSKISFDGYASAAILLNTGELVPANPSLYFRTVSSGNWSTPAIWEAADNLSFTGAFTPTYIPNNSNSLLIQIRNGHTVAISNNTVADDLVIDAGAVLTHSSGTLSINNGSAATDFLINGTFNANAPLTINSGSGVTNNNLWQTSTNTLTSAGSAVNQSTTAVYDHAADGGTIPTSTWDNGSTLKITGMVGASTIGGMNQSFHHIIYECAGQTITSVNLAGAVTAINGNLTINNTGGTSRELRLFSNNANTNSTLTITGDVIMNAGKLAVTNSSSNGAQTPVLTINGNLTLNGSSVFDLTGNSANTATSSTVNLLGNLTINSTATIVRSQATPSTFRFNKASGTQTFTAAAPTTAVSAGAINWQVGNGTTQPELVLANDFVMNAAATFTVNTAGILNVDTHILSGAAAGTNGSFTLNSGATLKTANTAGIVAALGATTGSIQTGTAKSFSTGASYIYTGTANQVTGTGLPLTLVSPGQITIANTGGAGNNTVTLTTNGTTTPTLNLQSGLFAIGTGSTLNIANTGSIAVTGGDFATGTTGGTVNCQGAATFSGNSNPYNVYTSGGVNFGTGTVTIQNGGTFRINSGGFVNTNAPFYASGSTLQYNTGGTYGRGFEWRAASGRGYPHHVLVSNSTTINPGASGNTGQPLNTGGNLTIESGSSLFMDFGGNNMTVPLTINGNLTLIGALSGSQTIGGDIRLRGNWINNGTGANFFPNSRAVFFDGSTAQTVGGTNATVNPFGFVILDNFNGITLLSSQQVNNEFTFINGQVTLGNFNLTMATLNAAVNGVTAANYFVTNGTGMLFRNFNNINTTFPIGPSTTAYNPIILNQAGTPDNIGVRAKATPPFGQSVNDANEMIKVEYYLTESVAGGNNLFTGLQWNLIDEGSAFNRNSGVYHGNWNGSIWQVRASNPTFGANPYFSNSTANYTGNLSNTLFAFGNINGFFPCLQTAASGDWNTGSTWNGGAVPSTDANVCLLHNVSVSTADATISNVTINVGGALNIGAAFNLDLLTLGNVVNNSGGTANLGSGTVRFLGTGAFAGTSGITATNVQLNGNTTFNAGITTTITGNLTMNSGSFITSGSPTYSATSTLVYNNTGSYNVNTEWTGNSTSPGLGIPQNVTIQNGTTVNMPNGNRGLAGNLNVTNGTLALNGTSGDLYVGGNWNRAVTSVFTPNNRAVFFNGASNQTISVTGGGTETFAYMLVTKTGGSLLLDNVNATDVTINASVGNVLQVNGGNTLDLNGRTLLLSGSAGNFNIPSGAASITGAAGSVFAVTTGTKTVTTGAGATLNFGPNVRVALSNGMNFGANTTTVQGILQIANGGFVSTNPPTYASGSTLRYFTGGNYSRSTEWSTTSGPGYPHNVEVIQNGTVTTLDVSTGSTPVQIAGNLTINTGGVVTLNNRSTPLIVKGNVSVGSGASGTLILSSVVGGDIQIAGNLSRLDAGVITQNGREIEMNGNTPQTIGGISSFEFLKINNTGSTVIIGAPITINNRLSLSSGTFIQNSYSVFMANGSKILRTNGLMDEPPVVVGSDQYDMEYQASVTTDDEYLGNNEIRDLIIGSGSTVTLQFNKTFNRNLDLAGDINLGGFTLTARGKATNPSFSGSINLTGGGTRTITGPAGSRFDITGLGANEPLKYPKTVSTLGGTQLVFDSNVLVRIGDGAVDFGTGNPVTINGVLQVLLGGSVGQSLNSCFYGTNSTLRFANTVDYQVGATDKTWAAGAINSGAAGIPWNVDINDGGTDLTLNDTRALRGNLTITNGTFTLSSAYSGSFNIGGNWTRSGVTSAFNN
ncbi:MAG: autotransporter-associated beta strand repeat-containing protein, partial [Bacteroidia bacterium]